MKLQNILFTLACLLVCGGTMCEAKPTSAASDTDKSKGAFYTGTYRNLFNEYLGVTQSQTDERLAQIWKHFFVDEDTKMYFEDSDSTAYIYDTGSHDVRTDGMSYGMMICVQMN